MSFILVLGVSLMVVAPLLRRYRMASPTVAVGASIVIALALSGLTFSDTARLGEEASRSNRRFYLTMLACEIPTPPASHKQAPRVECGSLLPPSAARACPCVLLASANMS